MAVCADNVSCRQVRHSSSCQHHVVADATHQRALGRCKDQEMHYLLSSAARRRACRGPHTSKVICRLRGERGRWRSADDFATPSVIVIYSPPNPWFSSRMRRIRHIFSSIPLTRVLGPVECRRLLECGHGHVLTLVFRIRHNVPL